MTSTPPRIALLVPLAILPIATTLRGQPPSASAEAFRMHPGVPRAEVIARTLAPYRGDTRRGVDTSSLAGKVLCGYQGWFTCPGDGSGRGWYHWERRGVFRPGSCSIDLWPDVRELGPDERFATGFRLTDGSPAEVYSPLVAKTVDRHFRWMKEYGIDGAFVQRFGTEIADVTGLYHFNTVAANCRAGANRHGRTWALMYDLTGLRRGDTQAVIDDWKLLVDRMRLGRDPRDAAYLRHDGKPVVGVWGVGFNDRRRCTLDECARLVEFLARDRRYGGNTVVLGVPTGWRTLDHDCVADEKLHDVIRAADVVCPWTVGRFRTPEEVERHARDVWRADLQWCREHGKDYLPVTFPGFSWHNMKPEAPLDEIPRLGGRFLWKQYTELRHLGAGMAYQAMFDEMDEGTAIFKCTNDPPAGASRFLTFDGLPSDHYLWLVGQGGRLLRGEIPATAALPQR